MIQHISANKARISAVAIAIIIFGGSVNGIAQDVKVKATLEKNKILIGDQVKMNISVVKPKNVQIVLPEFEPKLNDTIEIIEQFKPDTTILQDGSVLIEKNVILTVFDSGSYILAPIPVLFADGFKIDTVFTNELILMVNSVPLDTTNNIRDIKMPYGAPVTFREALPYILIFLGVLIIVAILVYVIIKLKRKEPIFKRFRPLEPAHIIAFRDLDKIKNQKLWQNDKVKDYYTGITDVLRHYLWNRYAIRTMERTSDEILQSLKESGFEDDRSFTILKDIFFTSDLVKFAKFKPGVDEHEKCFDGAFTFVDNTKLIIEENPEEGHEEKDGNPIETTVENKSIETNTIIEEKSE